MSVRPRPTLEDCEVLARMKDHVLEWYGVIDSDGIVVGRYGTAEEADAAVDELNGVYGPGVDAEYDYKSFTD